MRLSTRGRFAITAMIDLALREKGYPVPLSDLALRHSISLSYLEQVFAKLRHASLVESTRGPGGGYALGFRGDSITVADIIAAIDEGGNGSGASKGRVGVIDTQALWDSLNTAVFEHMKTITLKSLADAQRASGFQVKERRKVTKGVMAAPVRQTPMPRVPNSVFALGQAMGL
jgi:Rrf2 family iron-sulfur cluster assembly transcriptional regulator